MKILYVSHSEYLGGAEIMAFDLIKNLPDQTKYLVVSNRALVKDSGLDASVKVFEVKEIGQLGRRQSNIFRVMLRGLFKFFVANFKLLLIIMKTRPDMVQLINFQPAVYVLAPALILRRKIIWCAYDAIVFNRFDLYLKKILAGKCDGIVCVSEHVKRSLAEKKIVGGPGKTIVIYPGIDMNIVKDKKRGENGRFNIFCVGRLTRIKGQSFLIDSLSYTVNGGKNISISLVGEGEDRTLLENRIKAKELGIKSVCWGGSARPGKG